MFLCFQSYLLLVKSSQIWKFEFESTNTSTSSSSFTYATIKSSNEICLVIKYDIKQCKNKMQSKTVKIDLDPQNKPEK